MSYILDALRRAEAERERGAVPSLASQQHSIEVEDEAPPRSRGLVWAVIGLAFALIATLAWMLLGSHGTAPREIVQAPATPAPVAPAEVPRSLAEIAAAPSAVAAPAPPPTGVVPAAPLPSPATPPVPARATPSPPSPPTRSVEKPPPKIARAAPKAERMKAAAAATVVAPAPAPAGAASEPRIYAVAELPEAIRRDLPRIAINGSSYSGDAASRMVMVNGQVFHEGDQLSAGLVLDKIRRRSAVFAYKGYRYEVMF